MSKVWAGVSFAILVASAAPSAVARNSTKPTSSASPSAQRTTSNLDDDARETVLHDIHEREMTAIKPLIAQERAEVDILHRDKHKSAIEKRNAETLIRKKYLDRRNAERLRIKTELRAKLLRKGGS